MITNLNSWFSDLNSWVPSSDPIYSPLHYEDFLSRPPVRYSRWSLLTSQVSLECSGSLSPIHFIWDLQSAGAFLAMSPCTCCWRHTELQWTRWGLPLSLFRWHSGHHHLPYGSRSKSLCWEPLQTAAGLQEVCLEKPGRIGGLLATLGRVVPSP